MSEQPRRYVNRPKARLVSYTWNRNDADAVAGLALSGRCGHMTAHLTAAEARELADALHDAADILEAGHAA